MSKRVAVTYRNLKKVEPYARALRSVGVEPVLIDPEASIPIDGRGEVNLKRGGPHILLTGVKKQLGPYDSFLMTLTFARAGKVEVEVMVEEASVLEPAKH